MKRLALLLLVLLAAGVFAAAVLADTTPPATTTTDTVPTTTTTTTTTPAQLVAAGVAINGVALGGLSSDQAVAAVQAAFGRVRSARPAVLLVRFGLCMAYVALANYALLPGTGTVSSDPQS